MNDLKQQEYVKRHSDLIINQIELLESTRVKVKSYIDELLNTTALDVDRDVRINILNQINSIMTSNIMNMCFNVQQVANHSFQIQYFKTDTFKDADMIYTAYLKFNKNGFFYNLSAIIERYLRIVVGELAPTTDISMGIYSIKDKLFSFIPISKNGNEWNALKLLSLLRNTIHNNGIYLSKHDEVVMYHNVSYAFVNNKPHNFATYEVLNNIIIDLLSLVKIVNDFPLIKTKDVFIDQSLI